MKNRRLAAVGSLFVATALVAVGCGSATPKSSSSATTGPSGAASPSSGSRVLTVARDEQDMSLDPAVWYGAPGNDAETAVYEGLLKYQGSGTMIVPNLATSYTVSSNGLTYTFHLRPGVTFHDGTAFNSAAAKFSWQREITIGQGASYMLADVVSMATPGPLTFVVDLKTPNNAFLDYMCSPYAPKFVSPTAVKAHAGKDDGQTWLQTHDAGTGPYVLQDVVLNQSEKLVAYPGYWGPKPYYTTIKIVIIPSETTQVLELESGQLDMITAGLNPGDLKQLSGNSKFTVSYYPAEWTTYVMLNPHKGVFTNQKLRAATMAALNAKIITEGARGPAGTVPTQYSPYDMLPAGIADYAPPYDPSQLSSVVKTLSDKNVTIAWDVAIAPDQQAADIIQTELQAGGLNAKVVATNDASTLSWPGHPDQAADVTVISLNLDTANPANYFQVYLASNGILNINTTSIPAGDALIAKASTELTKSAADADYAQAARLYMAYDSTRPVTNAEAAIVARKGIVVAHNLLDPYGVTFADLKGS
jgi:peptide/nickel transport system substrate-binding protein